MRKIINESTYKAHLSKNLPFYATQGGLRFIEVETYDCFQDHHVKANIGIENLYSLLDCEITMPYVNTRYPLEHNCFFLHVNAIGWCLL